MIPGPVQIVSPNCGNQVNNNNVIQSINELASDQQKLYTLHHRSDGTLSSSIFFGTSFLKYLPTIPFSVPKERIKANT